MVALLYPKWIWNLNWPQEVPEGDEAWYKTPEMLKSKKQHLILTEEVPIVQKAKLFEYPYNKAFKSRIILRPHYHSYRKLGIYSLEKLIQKASGFVTRHLWA